MNSKPSEKPRVGITTGDPAGIGPEIVLKSVADQSVRAAAACVLVGDARELKRQASALGLDCEYGEVTGFEALAEIGDDVVIFDARNVTSEIQWGTVSEDAGRAAVNNIETAVRLCLSGYLDAVTTAPINKRSIRLAGSPFSGHTEMLASLCNARESLMCFFAGELRVGLLTTHIDLRTAINMIDKTRVLAALCLFDRELKRFGTPNPRIGVAGLNPHAGEQGLFGYEDLREIGPAVDEARLQHGINAAGPLPADTLFVRAVRGEFDAVLACYHDQGLIAVKCLAFGKAVNVTMGLPIIRTSVDHGTAFDIAGRGIADHQSMIEAIKLAASLAASRRAGNNSASKTQV